MAEEFSNYDLLDKMIANNKRAKSWTVFWVITLCLLAGVVLWLANERALNQQTISTQQTDLQKNKEVLESKTILIDSLLANCNEQKDNLVDKYDSVLTQTEQSINAIIKPSTNYGATITTGVSIADKNKLALVNKMLRASKTDLTVIKNKINKVQTKIFIQYNNKSDANNIARLVEALKAKGNYYVAPPEFINNFFPSIVKMYNHTVTENEKTFIIKLMNSVAVEKNDVKLKRETNSKLGDVIEIWVNGRPR